MEERELRLDDMDREIILLLHEDARMANAEIGRRVGVSGTAVKSRIDKLVKQGIIQVAERIDMARFGYDTGYLVTAELEISKSRELAERIRNMTEVRWAAFTTGTSDLFFILRLPRSRNVFDFLRDEIHALPGVRRTVTSLLLDEFKLPWDWPLPELRNVVEGAGAPVAPARKGGARKGGRGTG